MPRRLLFILCLLSLAAGGRAQTQATLFAPVPLAPTPLAEGALIVSEESARRALALGFAATAAAQAEQLVAGAEPESAARDAAALLLTAARLELDDTPGALRALGNHGPGRPPVWHLRAGLIAARDGLQAEAQAELARLRVDALPEEERAWFYLLQGMVLEAGREPAKAAAAYDQAQAVAVSDWQRARFRLARERLRLNQEGSVTEEQANDLRKQAERYAGRGVGTDYAVQYAVALATLGREKDAVAWLEAQLAGLLDPSLAASRDDVRLMLGLIAGPAQAAGRGALEQLLGGGSDATKQRMALQLLAEATESTEARNRLRGTLDELLMRVPAHPLQEEMLLVRAELSLADLAYGRAEADAKELLARFPGSPQKARALTQLAAVA